jgi:hypothetical protein
VKGKRYSSSRLSDLKNRHSYYSSSSQKYKAQNKQKEPSIAVKAQQFNFQNIKDYEIVQEKRRKFIEK